jgi:hypothetical protein
MNKTNQTEENTRYKNEWALVKRGLLTPEVEEEIQRAAADPEHCLHVNARRLLNERKARVKDGQQDKKRS